VTILPGLTSTDGAAVPRFVEDLRASDVRAIALFPTVLGQAERAALYAELGAIGGLTIPHVHLRSDCDEGEMQELVERFGTEVFNIHPRASRHPFGAIPARFARRIFVENADVEAEDDELRGLGGLCPDYSHVEGARLAAKRPRYVEATDRQLAAFPIGCCHVSAIRAGVPNPWNGQWDHHRFAALSDLDYVARYRHAVPARWISLELENPLAEQVAAAAHLLTLIDGAAR
jgi:hypothetical protein